MNIRLICMDLDGTALLNDHKTLTPRLLKALEDAHAKGIAIAPVTGRQYALLPPPLLAHPIWENLVVLCNGGQVRKLGTGEILYSLSIGTHELRQLLALAERYDLPIEFSLDSKLHLTKHSLDLQQNDSSLHFHRDTILANHGCIVDSLEPLCGMAVEKINLLCIPDNLRQAVELDLKHISVSAVWASPTGMEITHHDASKGNALQVLCRLLNIPPENVMALGDSGNDETMLRQAGLGIAMGNAPDVIKAAANVVTETNINNGAAIAIERYALHLHS